MAPFCQRKACTGVRDPGLYVESPTTCPASFIARASLVKPPSVPKSVIVPFDQRNAWLEEVQQPTTRPKSHIPPPVTLAPRLPTSAFQRDVRILPRGITNSGQ